MGIEPERIKRLNQKAVQAGEWVLYWMQQSQRPHDNPALEVAITRANRLGLPVLVVFALTERYPEANLRHYRFMLEGLAETRRKLARRRIGLVIQKGDPPAVVGRLARRAAVLVCDVGYTRQPCAWRRVVARSVSCEAIAVEGDVVVPVGVVSQKAEYAARTIRPKINRHLENFLVPCPRYRPKISSLNLRVKSLDPDDPGPIMAGLAVESDVPAVTTFFKGGPGIAKKRLRQFIQKRLGQYRAHSNQPQTDNISHMGPYLHFGQISPVYLTLEIAKATSVTAENRDTYLEEVIIRRELAANFVTYTPDYDCYSSLPVWARKSLAAHAGDRRPYLYDRPTLVAAATHDPYWNAAMTEMRDTGFMHNYMRMYWGKKILEWSPSPEDAYATALALNNRYFLDGRDPNSYAGVGWVFGLHDRAWFEREIFGKVRYMAASGLERKCDIQAYVGKVAALSRRVRRSSPAAMGH